jgi:hypothetical protein
MIALIDMIEDHPLWFWSLVITVVIVVGAQIPMWVFISEFYADDANDMETFVIGGVTSSGANIFVRSPFSDLAVRYFAYIPISRLRSLINRPIT